METSARLGTPAAASITLIQNTVSLMSVADCSRGSRWTSPTPDELLRVAQGLQCEASYPGFRLALSLLH